jgi:hypothetical protein
MMPFLFVGVSLILGISRLFQKGSLRMDCGSASLAVCVPYHWGYVRFTSSKKPL